MVIKLIGCKPEVTRGHLNYYSKTVWEDQQKASRPGREEKQIPEDNVWEADSDESDLISRLSSFMSQ